MTKIHKIYVLYTGVFCKIGVTSRKVEDRVKEIQTSCPLPIYSYSVIGNLSKHNAYFIENKLKTHLNAHLTFGEWYKQFDNIKRSVSYLIKSTSSEDFTITDHNTSNDKFEDISIKKLNDIKKYLTDNDLDMMSKLYTDLAFNKNYSEVRFFLYSKHEVVKQLEIAIRNTIKYFSNNSIEIKEQTSKCLISANNKLNKEENICNEKESRKVKKTKTKPKNVKSKMDKVMKNYPFLFNKEL